MESLITLPQILLLFFFSRFDYFIGYEELKKRTLDLIIASAYENEKENEAIGHVSIFVVVHYYSAIINSVQ